MKVMNDNKTGLLDSLTRGAQSKPQKDVTTGKTGNDGGGDKVELSSKKEQISEVRERVKSQSVIRQDKVDEMKAAIQNQTYNVKGELVARSMMKSQLLDQLL